MKPIEGARAGGVTGFFSGVAQGAVGVVTKPVAGVVSCAKIVNDSYFKETQKLARIRMPRAVFGDHLLRSFDADNAATFWHLQKLEAQLREQRQRVTEHARSIESLSEEVAERDASLSARQRELATTTDALAEAKARIASLEAELGSARAAVSKARTALGVAQAFLERAEGADRGDNGDGGEQ